MNKEVNENWINTYIKNNPFGFKETIIHRCRQMDKADVYEWVANNEVKIILLQQKVNQLETNIDEAYKLLDDIDEYMLTEQHLKLIEAKKLLESSKD